MPAGVSRGDTPRANTPRTRISSDPKLYSGIPWSSLGLISFTHTNATQVEADRRTYIEAIYTELNAAGDAMADDAQALL